MGNILIPVIILSLVTLGAGIWQTVIYKGYEKRNDPKNLHGVYFLKVNSWGWFSLTAIIISIPFWV